MLRASQRFGRFGCQLPRPYRRAMRLEGHLQQVTAPRLCRHTDDMGTPRHSGSIFINRSPEEVYDMIADVTRMGEWSPMCTACWWDDGDGPRVGAKFTGKNELAERTWETRSEVVGADRGLEFAWVVA